MAEVVRYVDPDATGAGDGTSWTDAYTSLSAWDSNEATDLVTDGDWHHCYVRSSGGTADTTAMTVGGWTTGASNYILIEAADGDEAKKDGWDTSRYRIEATDDTAIEIRVDYVRLDGLQAKIVYSSENTFTGVIDVSSVTASANDVRMNGLRIEADLGGTADRYIGISSSDSDAELTITNCIVYNLPRRSYELDAASGSTVSHCIAHGASEVDGFRDGDGTITFTNCASFNNNDDFDNAGTVTYCASDDGDGTNSVSPSGSDWDNEFSDPANGDFTLLNSGNCYQGGTTISGGPSTDMDGDSWDGTSPSIGVDEYVAAGGTTYDVSTGDGVSLSDSSGGVLTVAASTSDGISLSDTPSAVLTITASVSDGMSLGDSDSGTWTLAASAVDGITLSDAIAAGFTFGVDTSDGITLSDSSTTGGTIEVSAADGITLTDSSSAVRDILATVADGITLSDVSSSTATISAQVADGISFSDTVRAALSILASVSDGITLSDIAIDATFLPVGRVRITVSSAQASVTITTKQAGVDVTFK